MYKNAWILFIFLSFLIPSLNGQKGPGGVGYQDNSEEEQPELVLWLNASNLSLNNHEAVVEWEDMSGNGHTALSGSASSHPLFLERGIRNLPAVYFNGSSWFSVAEKSNLDGGPGISVFSVLQPMAIDVGGGMKIVSKRNHWDLWNGFTKETCQYSYNFDFHGKDESQYLMAHINGNFPDNKVETPALYGDTSQVLLVNYTYHNGYSFIRVNGEVNASDSKPNPNQGMTGYGPLEDYDNDLTIASGKYEPTRDGEKPVADFFTGKMSEVIIFREGLDSTRLFIVENYLAAKYGISTGEDKRFQDSICHQNLIGIGNLNGKDVHREAGNGILTITETRESLNEAGDFLFIADNNEKPVLVTDRVPDDWDERWSTIWKIEKNGTVSANFVFSYIEADMRLSRDKEYALCYAENPEDDFEVLNLETSAKFGALMLELENENLRDGYYSLAERTVSGLGINTLMTEAVFCFPNPVKNEIFIQSDFYNQKAKIKVCDLSGKIHMNLSDVYFNGKGKLTLGNLDFLQSGIYLLYISTINESEQLKFFKE